VVQHLASAVIFVTSFVAIYIEVVSPVSIVGISSVLTVAGWAVWDMGWEKREAASERAVAFGDGMYEAGAGGNNGGMCTDNSTSTCNGGTVGGMDFSFSGNTLLSYGASSYFLPVQGSHRKSSKGRSGTVLDKDYTRQLRRSRVIATAKSALLIYCTKYFPSKHC
jgi:phosphatidylinositol glycan class C protein